MKKLSIALAALGAAFMATAASAEPVQDTKNYYFVGSNDNVTTFISDSVETHGPGVKKDVWAFMFNRTQEVIEGKKVDGAWLLLEIDCDKSTMQIIRMEAATSEGNVKLSSSTQAPTANKPGTNGQAVENLLCKNDDSGVTLLSMEQTVAAMLAFRNTK